MQKEEMDRGTDALKAHLGGTATMSIRQTRRGWLQELFGCEARTEFKYFIGDNQVAQSLDDASCCCRVFCKAIYPFSTQIKELNSDAELLSVERPFRCAAGGCKCCCYQELIMTSGGQSMGSIKENCYFCVPQFKIYGPQNEEIYKVHPPTCCCGMCVNCCTEGNPCCGRGCCKVPFWIFDAKDKKTNGSNVKMLGKIVKVPKSLMVEVFTDANAFDVTFPTDANVTQKALLMGSALLLNATFFEEK